MFVNYTKRQRTRF